MVIYQSSLTISTYYFELNFTFLFNIAKNL